MGNDFIDIFQNNGYNYILYDMNSGWSKVIFWKPCTFMPSNKDVCMLFKYDNIFMCERRLIPMYVI